MKNWIIVLLVFVVPLCLFAFLESNKASVANETKISKNTLVETNGKPTMLKFSSAMCSDCKKVNKELITVIEDYKDAVSFEEIDVSDGTPRSKESIKTYKISVVPTLIFVSKDGKVINKTEGFITKEEIRQNLENIKQ